MDLVCICAYVSYVLVETISMMLKAITHIIKNNEVMKNRAINRKKTCWIVAKVWIVISVGNFSPYN